MSFSRAALGSLLVLLVIVVTQPLPCSALSTGARDFSGNPDGIGGGYCTRTGSFSWPIDSDGVIEFWLKVEDPDQRAGSYPLFSWDDSGTINKMTFNVINYVSGTWEIVFDDSSSTATLAASFGCLDHWCFISIIRDYNNEELVLSVDGTSIGFSSLSGVNFWTADEAFYLGAFDLNGQINMLNGTTLSLDELTLYTGLFGAANIEGTSRPVPPYASSLVSYVDFDGGDLVERVSGSTAFTCTGAPAVPTAVFQANANRTLGTVGPVVIPGQQTTIEIVLRDQYANLIRVGGDVFTLQMVHVASSTSVTPDSQVDNGDGSYTITYTPPLPGFYAINSTLDGLPTEIGHFSGGGVMMVSLNEDIEVAADCSLGTVHVPGNISAPCEPCAEDQWSDETGFVSTCTECGENLWSAEQVGLDAELDCLCVEGYYRSDPAVVECVACPEGAACAGQIGDQDPVALPGFYESPTQANVFLECPRPESCLGGVDSLCAVGTTGVMCQDCADGYYALSGNCVPCPDQTVYIVGGMVLFTLFMVIVLLRFGSGVQKFGILSIGVNFLQVLAMFPVFQVDWPPQLLTLFNYLQPLLFNTDVFAAECTIDNVGHFDRVALQLVFPVVIAVVLIFMYACVWCGNKIYLKFEHGVTVSKSNLSANPLADLPPELVPTDDEGNLPPWMKPGYEEPKKTNCFAVIGRATGILGAVRAKNAFRSKCYNAFAQFLLVAYPWLTRASVEIFACFEGSDGVRYMTANSSIVCGSEEWNSGLPVSLAGLGFYTIFLPGSLFIAMYRNREYLGKTRWRFRVGTLYERFDDSFWAWEFLLLMRKNFLILIIVFMGNPGQELLQVYAGMVVLVISLLLNMKYLPYWTPTLNNLESLTLLTSALCLGTGIAYHTGAASGLIGGLMIGALLLLVVGTLLALAYGSYGQLKTMEGRRPKEWADDMTMEDF